MSVVSDVTNVAEKATGINWVKWALVAVGVIGISFGIWYNFHYIASQNREIGTLKSQQATLVQANKNLQTSIDAQNLADEKLHEQLKNLQDSVQSSQKMIIQLQQNNSKLMQELNKSPAPEDNDCQAQMQWLRQEGILTKEYTQW